MIMTLLAVCPRAAAQQADAPSSSVVVEDAGGLADSVARSPAKKKHEWPLPKGEISVMGMVPYGDYRLFGATVRCHAWTIGLEYDRRIGHILGARFDWATEVIPVMILSQPKVSDFWGNGLTQAQELVPGISISPVGMRFLYRDGKKIRPFFLGKLGAAVFTQKALSPDATYVNFNIQAAFGVQYAINNRYDLRVEPFQFFHISNGYLAASNPGMDQLGWQIGFTYHLKNGRW
jgi:lipid A 3-O-deacylase PagL